jgi:hypothetical protein
MTQAAWAGRMAAEKYELMKRIANLENFIRTSAFEQLPRDECDDLHEQLGHMQAYHAVLQRRYDRIPPTGPEHLAPWELGRETR